MASIQEKNGTYYCQFMYAGKRKTFTIGEVSETEANQWKGRAELLLMRIDQGLLTVPIGADVADFVKHDGNISPSDAQRRAAMTTLSDLRSGYESAFSAGGIEKNTLSTAKIHFGHLEATFGKRFVLSGTTAPTLQKHINRRQKEVEPVTIKKELDTLRTAWNWGMHAGLISQPFPTKGLVYPKTEEKLPFMNWAEIERRIKAGGDSRKLWECLYLDGTQVDAFLKFAESSDGWVYAALVMAAHTGARRGEMARLRIEDVDVKGKVITLREKKRARGVVTTRRVPMSTRLIQAITPLLERNKDRIHVFGNGLSSLTPQALAKAFQRLVEGSKWEVLKGYHVLRHSFISTLANKGVDQRIIDELVSHSTEEQRRRYRHLFPQTKNNAIKSVFG